MKRDFRIDVLRTIGIISIILAHTSPPEILSEARIFDVPLMAMLLGMSFVLSMKGKNFEENYGSYVVKRFKRLIIPTWIFLTIFFSSIFLLKICLKISYPFSIKEIITSYALISGIGYVWIIRVFFTIGLVSPLLLYISRKIKKLLHQILFIYGMLLIQQVLCMISGSLSGYSSKIFESLIAISFGYIICAMVGFWVVNLEVKQLAIFAAASLIPFLIMNISIPFLSLSEQKYPPSPFFVLYGISVSLILLLVLSNNQFIETFKKITFFNWASKYSLEIYFWHIVPIMFFSWAMPDLSWIVKFSLATIGSCCATYIQTKYMPSLLSIK